MSKAINIILILVCLLGSVLPAFLMFSGAPIWFGMLLVVLQLSSMGTFFWAVCELSN